MFPVFEVLKGASTHWYWRLKARNGEIIAVSESYSSESAAIEGAKSARRNSRFAKIERN